MKTTRPVSEVDDDEVRIIRKQTCCMCGGRWFPSTDKIPKYCRFCASEFWQTGTDGRTRRKTYLQLTEEYKAYIANYSPGRDGQMLTFLEFRARWEEERAARLAIEKDLRAHIVRRVR